jgi:photosynthetic reaction center cytochrome c subunit
MYLLKSTQKIRHSKLPRLQFGPSRIFIAVCLLVSALECVSASAQTPPLQQSQMAETVFKNVQVLRGIPVDEFMETMGFFAASLGLNCVECHTADSGGNWAKFADDTPRKQMTRRMVLMVRAINQANFGGTRSVTCYSCHRGSDHPEISPSLADQYATPPPDDPDRIQVHGDPITGAEAEQVLNKYIQAIGGEQQLGKLTNFMGKGTYVGYDTDDQMVPVEVFAKTPNQYATIVHAQLGDSTSTFNGQEGWVASINQPLPLITLTADGLEGARADAELAIPIRIKQDFTNWHIGFPDVSIDGKRLQVIEGATTKGTRIKLYFDKQSNLLVRQTRYSNTIVGPNPIHVEYSDYRTVAGVKIPFHWVKTWTDGQSTTQLTEVSPNAAIEASKFAKPAPAQPPKPGTK